MPFVAIRYSAYSEGEREGGREGGGKERKEGKGAIVYTNVVFGTVRSILFIMQGFPYRETSTHTMYMYIDGVFQYCVCMCVCVCVYRWHGRQYSME